ncbi:MAG: carbonic anhydrase [Bellilinea sp.]
MNIKNTKTCHHLLVTCMDYRIQAPIGSWAVEQLGSRNYDYLAVAGSSRQQDAVLAHVVAAIRLHQITSVELIHHEDCGAYGSEGNYARHAADMRSARRKILAQHPELQVRMYYLLLSGEMCVVEAE